MGRKGRDTADAGRRPTDSLVLWWGRRSATTGQWETALCFYEEAELLEAIARFAASFCRLSSAAAGRLGEADPPPAHVDQKLQTVSQALGALADLLSDTASKGRAEGADASVMELKARVLRATSRELAAVVEARKGLDAVARGTDG